MSATKSGLPHQPFTSEESCLRASSNRDCDSINLDRIPSDQSSTISPSSLTPFQYNASLHALDTASPQAHPTIVSPHTPHSAGLRVRTDIPVEKSREESTKPEPKLIYNQAETQEPSTTTGLPVRSSSLRSTLAAARPRTGSLSPASALSSPGVGPLMDLTPLPSPVTAIGTPASWRRSIDSGGCDGITQETGTVSTPMGSHLEPIVFARASPKKRGIRTGILSTAQGIDGPELQQIEAANASSHARNRSLSEYVPDPVPVPRMRNIVVSGSGASPVFQLLSPPESHMHREEYLAVQRGLTLPTTTPPTPPRSNRGTDSSDLDSPILSPGSPVGQLPLRYEARTIRGGKLKQWKAVRQLGKGTFSTVMLAIDESVGSKALPKQPGDILGETIDEDHVDPHALVAVKVCEQGPAGGADEAKVETSLKREVEILKSIHHPSLVHLKAFSAIDRRALLVLNYCAGGDLFDLASLKLELLLPSLIRRIFAELAAAVRYLHVQYIVHRDIKLENVLVNIRTSKLSTVDNWQTYPAPIVTLTDLGLGRWIPKPPESPLLDTRCGSEDYAAPELLMGQEYDGRATDAWALGVLLYALMEGRLPFDPIPGSRKKSPTSHRIARCEWSWVRWADKDGEWDPKKGEALEGGRVVVEGLLARARSRWGLEKVENTDWVSQAMQIEGGLSRVEDDYKDDDA